MHLPYSPNPTPPPTTTHPALHNKWATTKPSCPQAHKSTAGSKKIAQRQHIKQTLQRLRESNDLFLDNSVTQAEDECTAIAKNNTNNAKSVAIDSAHAQCNQPTIGLAQRGKKLAYRLGLAFNQNMSVLPNRTKSSYSMPCQPLESC
jgi:hypothetical protein